MRKLSVAAVVGAVLTLALVFSQAAVQAAPNRVTTPKGSKFRPLATSVVTAGRGDQTGVQDSKTPSKFECRASGDRPTC